jgi:membrane protein YdbS with pleckstrin-like domain
MLQLENLREGEEIKLVIKRHWIIYVMLWVYTVLWVVVIFTFYFIMWFTAVSSLLNILFLLVFLLFLYVSWLDHELDMYIITNNRIVWVDQTAFLNRTVSECNLWQVQEVNSTTKGFFANMLNYGTLLIHTAWTNTTMQMDFSPNAMQQARKILNIVDSYEKEE